MTVLDDLAKRKEELQPTNDHRVMNIGRAEADEFDLLYIEIGKRVREKRLDKRFSQTDLAEAAGIGRTTLSNLERQGQRIGIHNLYVLAFLLDVPVYELLPAALPVWED